MHWDAYTGFSVASGLAMIVAGCLAIGVKPKDRFTAIAAGALFLAYGIYVAKQTSGVWVFPWVIFVVPFAAVGYLGYGWWQSFTKRAESATPPPPPAQPVAGARPGAPAAAASVAVAITACSPTDTTVARPLAILDQVVAEPVAVTCGGCGATLPKLVNFCARCGRAHLRPKIAAPLSESS